MQDLSCVPVIKLGATPNLGDLLGSQSSAMLASYINSYEDKSQFFGSSFDRLQEYRQQFVNKLVTPVRQAGATVSNYLKQVLTPEEMETIPKAIETYDELREVPSYMVLPILTYEPIYNLHKQGRIDGYGLDPHHIKLVKPVYDRLIRDNGTAIVNPVYTDYPHVFVTQEYWSTDPYLNADQIDSILDTLNFIDDVLEDTQIDPTCPDQIRG